MQTSKKPLEEIVVKKTYFDGKRRKSRRKKKSKKVKKKMEVTRLNYSGPGTLDPGKHTCSLLKLKSIDERP